MSTDNLIETLHVASFTGNVGDNANHNGTRQTLAENSIYEFSYTETEIRKYYQNYTASDSLAFDDEFVTIANDHDLVLIGGGNFFELWIEDSVTGTTIDMTKEIVDKIDTPIVFYGLGCDPHKGIPGDNKEKFEDFLSHILGSDHCLVSVRNDGSLSHIERIFGKEYAKRVKKVPDGGFFTEVDDRNHPQINQSETTIALNVATDMPELRFPREKSNSHSYERFIDELAEFIDEMINELDDLHFVLMPHIYSDITAISDVLIRVDDINRRSRVTMAPYLSGDGSERYIFDIYRKADLAMGMRFHTNVCSIGQNTPTIGLVSYPKVGDLYEIELGLQNRIVDVRKNGFKNELTELTQESLCNASIIEEEYDEICTKLRMELDQFHSNINKLLK